MKEGAPDPRTLTILRRYSAGEISSREAAREIRPRATGRDVFAGILAAHLPLPKPSPEEVAREVAALHALYGPHGSRLRGQPDEYECDTLSSAGDGHLIR